MIRFVIFVPLQASALNNISRTLSYKKALYQMVCGFFAYMIFIRLFPVEE